MPLSPKIDLERVPSPLSEERPIEGGDYLDRVSILDSPIPYSLEVEVVSTKPSLEGEGGDDVVPRREIVKVVF